MMPYVVSYRCDTDDLHLELMSMKQLADLIGMADFNECVDFHVWRLVHGQLQPLRIQVLHKENCVMLCDRFGNYVDDACYEAH